jgi:ankyrin repeat protein
VGDLNNLQRLIKNNKSLLYEKDALGRTLLYLAARNGYYNIVEYLLKNGSNVNEA